jgi:fumarate reductase (CoM/CoB) subunit A
VRNAAGHERGGSAVTETVATDVLVVGAGGAGMRAAYDAHLAGARVLIAVKGRFGAIGTRGAGATAAGLSEIGLMRMIGYHDEWSGEWDGAQTRRSQVFGNIVQAGLGMADREIAQAVVDEAAEVRKDLEDWGMVPTFANGFGIKTHGVPIKITLESVIRRTPIDVRERTAVVRLLTGANGSCVGAVAVDEKSGELLVIRAAATILAAGGMGRLFSHSFHPSCVTGDAYSLAHLAGAELMNMEFHQIFIGTVEPNANLVGSWLWRDEPQLTNAQGEPFLESYVPAGHSVDECFEQRRQHTPFSTRDELSRYIDIAMVREIKAGRGTESGGVLATVATHGNNGPSSDVGEWYTYRGVHWDRGPVEIGLFHHCSNGGVRVDVDGQSSVPGLFAVGESAAGAHGADRLGGMMLVASQVFGRRAGRRAAEHRGVAGEVPAGQVREVEADIDRYARGRARPEELGARLGKLAWDELLVERSQAGLERAIDEIQEMRASCLPQLHGDTPLSLVRALELQNGLVTAEIVARASLERRESRGGHHRVDFPERDDDHWLHALVVRRRDGGIEIVPHRVDPTWKPRSSDLWGKKWG